MDPETTVEEKFKFKVEKITGARGADCATEIFRRRLTFTNGESGELVSCILLSGAASEDLGVYLGDIFELAVKRLEDSGENILESLKLALESGQEYGAGKGLELNFIHCFFYKDACFVGKFGNEVSLMVFRGTETGVVDIRLGSGPIVDGQIYLIATRAFLGIFDQKIISEGRSPGLEDVIDGLATTISDIEDQSEIGAVFIAIMDGENKIVNTEVGIVGDNEEVLVNDIATESNVSTVEGSLDDSGDLREVPQVLVKSKFKNPIPDFFGNLFGELRKLKRGDIRAIFRLRRNIVALCIIVVLVLVGSVVYNLNGQNQKKKTGSIVAHMAVATSKYTESLALMEINKERARLLLVDADNEVKAALALDSKNIEANKLKDVISAKLKETESATSVKFETISEFANPVGGLAFSEKNLVAVHGDKLTIINLSNNQTTEIKVGNDTKSVAVYSGDAYILTGDKVEKVNLSTQKAKIIAEESGIDIDVFFGNVYILAKDQIRKFIPIESGYSGSDYLGDDFGFSDKSHITIDSSVWITKGDKILKFTRGSAENYDISGLVNTNFVLGAIYTNADIENLYVIDSVNSVLLVIDKTGLYKKVYQSAEFAKVNDLVVDETAGKMYLGVGRKILSSSL